MKFGICNETFQGWKLDDIFAYCARIGYDAVEIAPFTLAKYVTDIPAAERARIRDVAARGGITVSGIHLVLVQADGTIYASVVRQIRWKGKPYPGATIDHHLVVVPNFGRIYFGEIFISVFSRRLTMLRLQLGSPVGGFAAFSEAESNGSWYP